MEEVIGGVVSLPVALGESLVPSPSSGFTATVDQLNNLGSSVGSTSYQQAVNTAFNNIYSTLGANQMVAWSSSQGYYAVDVGSSDYYDYWY